MKKRLTQGLSISNTDASLWAELLFTFLPFLITFIVLFYQGEILGLLFIPEWSLASAILSGQSIVKFIQSLLKYGKELNLGIVAFIISTLIVILLAPSLIVLSLILISSEPVWWLAIAQIIFFSLSLISFLILGHAGEYLLAIKRNNSI